MYLHANASRDRFASKTDVIVTVPKDVAKIYSSEFEGFNHLEEIHFHDGVKDIGGSAFAGCSKLKKVTLPPNIKVIKSETFKGCTSLEEVVIARSVTIEKDAFAGCKKMKRLAIPNGSVFSPWGFDDLRRADYLYLPGINLDDVNKETYKKYKRYCYNSQECKPIEYRRVLAMYYLTSASDHSPEEQKVYDSFIKKSSFEIFKIIVDSKNTSALTALLDRKLVSSTQLAKCIEYAELKGRTDYLKLIETYSGNSGIKPKAKGLMDFTKIKPPRRLEIGSYNRKPIKWRIVAMESTRALLVAEECIDVDCPFDEPVRYSYELSDPGWETSHVRQWLNTTFYNEAFDDHVREHILSTTIVTECKEPYNRGNRTLSYARTTEDRIFILSNDETVEYLGRHSNRAIKTTEAPGKQKGNNKKRDCYWLRNISFGAMYIDQYGNEEVYAKWDRVDWVKLLKQIGVRPAMWVDITK